MSSPHFIERADLLIRGVDLPFGSLLERVAMGAVERERAASFMATMSIVNAIIQVGNNIVSAGSKDALAGGDDKLKKSLDSLRDILIPEDEFKKEEKAARIKRILEEESSKGTIRVRPMVSSKKNRNRIVRRGDIDGSGPK